jgi:hypothetical protein
VGVWLLEDDRICVWAWRLGSVLEWPVVWLMFLGRTRTCVIALKCLTIHGSLYCVILIGQSASLLAFLLGGNSLLGHCLEYLEVWKRIHCLSIENETKMKVKWRYHSTWRPPKSCRQAFTWR